MPPKTLKEAVALADAIKESNAGKPMDRVLLAGAVGYSPGSSGYRELLRAGAQYGLTSGSEKATHVGLTRLGLQLTTPTSPSERSDAIRLAAMQPEVAKRVYDHYNRNKWVNNDLFRNVLARQFGVDPAWAEEVAELLHANAVEAGFVRAISGSTVLLTSGEGVEGNPNPPRDSVAEETAVKYREVPLETEKPAATTPTPAQKPSQIFVGHGRSKVPLEQLKAVLGDLRISFKVAIDEPNKGLPIPTKVADLMRECSSAILIFTKDIKLFDENGKEVWLASENVSHELGAASVLYGGKIIVFKEKGLEIPTNFKSIGYIEFDHDDLRAKTMDLLKELIAFGLVRLA